MRGGYGIFYSRTSFQYITLNVIAPPTYVFGVSAFSRRSANPYFAAPPTSAFPTLVPGVALSGTLFDRNIRTPYLHQYNFSAQYEVFKDYLLEAAYVGTHGANLFRQVGINQAKLASPANPITNAVTGAVITTNTPANASLARTVPGRFRQRLFPKPIDGALKVQLAANESDQTLREWSPVPGVLHLAKSIDNASGQGGGPGAGGVLNPGAVGETSAILGNQLDNRANRGTVRF